MSDPKALLAAGDLRGAVDAILAQVKAKPADEALRTFLFELCCFTGEWDRAEKQLDVIGHQDMKAAIGVQAFQQLVKAERDREKLFTQGLHPHFLLDPPAYVDMHLEAINRVREGNIAEARALLDKAEEARPAISGKLNGAAFEDIRDYNDFLGPILEVIINGQYTWLPFEQMRGIEIIPVKQLRDLRWASAKIEALDGTVGDVFIPTLYPGTHNHADDQVRLGRATDWHDLGNELYQGAGLRILWVAGEDTPLLSVRGIEFDVEEPAEADQSAEAAS